MKVSLICCGRLENRYAIEFVEYYQQLGFDHIYIADNNHDNEEYFEDVLQFYINNNFVTIYNYRNLEAIQWYAYAEIYNKINNKYDYIFFCDFDEYLTLVKDNNIKDYLSRNCFNNYNQILINWKIYSDNDLIYDDGRKCLNRFTSESKYSGWKCGLVKQFLKSNIKDIYLLPYTVHMFTDNNLVLEKTSCNNCGESVKLHKAGVIYPNYELAYIKHFTTKTIDEYVNVKLKRGTADMSYNAFNQKNKNDIVNDFFEINNKTQEKINYFIKHNILVSDEIQNQ